MSRLPMPTRYTTCLDSYGVLRLQHCAFATEKQLVSGIHTTKYYELPSEVVAHP